MMKNTQLRLYGVFAATVVLGAGMAWASTATQVSAARKALKGLPAVELPAKAADMVAQALPEERNAAAAAVATAAIDLRPTATLAVVSAIARQSPTVAATVAQKAASLQPKQLTDIAAAAASVAPKQAANIVEALCKAAPTRYAAIVTAVAKVVPTASQEILSAVFVAIPSLKPFVEKASSEYAGQNPSIGLLMARTEMWVAAVARETRSTSEKVLAGPVSPVPPTLAPPQPGPPYAPLPEDAVIVQIRGLNTTNAPPGGGRDYSAP